jgi:hypothetical protein
MITKLKEKIDKKLEIGALPAKVLQSKFKVGFPLPIHGDPTFMPFYYHLGKCLPNTENLLEFGFDLGMPSGCFIDGCPSVKHFLAFRKQNEQYYPKRIGISNIQSILKKKFDLWVGEETDPEFIKLVLFKKWDCVILSDSGKKEQTYRAYLDLAWNQMSDDGIIIVDFLNEAFVKSAFTNFCILQGREQVKFNTLRGTGIIQR